MSRAGGIRIFGAMDLAVLAGVASTGLFAMSYLPMLMKAGRTKDLSSYSLGNLAITNAGNALYSVYVFSLPLGPIWFLHTFYLVTSAVMLGWFLRYRTRRAGAPDAPAPYGRHTPAGRHARTSRTADSLPGAAASIR
jgi:uncharacterized protein with PQ loop repeat